MWSRLQGPLHGEVGDVGVGGDLELEDPHGGGGVPVEHGAVHGGEGVARDDGGLDGELLDVRFDLLRRNVTASITDNTWFRFASQGCRHGYNKQTGPEESIHMSLDAAPTDARLADRLCVTPGV